MVRRPLSLLITLCSAALAWGQCGPLISSFPYAEGFEASAAWTSGGIGNDWAWGAPAHPLINTAGGGNKSWCVGDLTGQFYELDAQSWLMSPCFDFTTLQRPWISLKIFWETEREFDGIVLQYSLDGGITWSNVGAYGDPEDCLNTNWYNESNVYNLDQASPHNGWSGRQGNTSGACLGGQGSEEWLTATHCMAELAGEPSVRFRFLFGSGNTCNNYDGVAIDDVLIQESPAPVPAFTLACTSTVLHAENQTTGCVDGYVWDFGDPGSGPANHSTMPDPTHSYAQPGTYIITLSVNTPCGPPVDLSMTVAVVGSGIEVTPATCGLANGAALSVITAPPAAPSYVWTPGGQTDQGVTGMDAGQVSVIVSAPGMCTTYDTASIGTSATDLDVEPAHTDVSCADGADGTASVSVTGTAEPFTFAWTPDVSSSSTASGLEAGTYAVEVTDGVGCSATEEIVVAEPEPLIATAPLDVPSCAGASVELVAEATGGTGAAEFVWSPEGPVVAPVVSTSYSVVATDTHGCVSPPATTTVSVTAAIVPELEVDVSVGCMPHCVEFTVGPPGVTPVVFDYGDGISDAGPAHCFESGGLFDVTLTVADANGCTGTITVDDLVEAFPSPVAGFSAPSTVLITKTPLQVIDGSAGADSWSWDFGGGSGEDTVAAPLVDFPGVGCYVLRQAVMNDHGCTDTARAEVCVENEFAVYAPNAFTPNDDGMNETFMPVTTVRNPAAFELIIFDRWGGLVFSSSSPTQGWTADGVMDGIYVWRLSLRDTENKLQKSAGHVLVLR